MENTQNTTTVRAENVPYDEIHDVRTKLYQIVDDHVIDGDGPLITAIFFILDTLEAGKDVTITTEPAPEDYVLVH